MDEHNCNNDGQEARGCALMIFAAGLAIALFMWAAQGFPGLSK